ncbi:MAG TPA: tRNA 2-thiouridine(34) synthase MnmA [Longimicrobiales bacterium]|nr:tRNA 2-thiouridine(34) synthase MnmA [Longimicrobiales bacterium]
MTRVLVAMSGGVDSSVAAALLKEAGHDVVGVTMKTFCYSGTPAHAKTCCGLDGIADARRVAVALDIPHYVFDVEEDFTRDVVDDFVSEYARGRTPNPCVRCNGNTKFRDLLARGRALECETIASGHYVRWEDGPGGPRLLRGADRTKDQSYFLWELDRAILPRLRFPLGDLTKAEVRERARSLGLSTADKPESQEICFVPTGDYRDLLRRKLGPVHPALQPGRLVDRRGNVLGEHDGYAGFTVGQRKGLGGGLGEPRFVLEIRPDAREVVVGRREELMARLVEVRELNWLTGVPEVGSRLRVQLRHRAADVPARVREAGSRVRLELLQEVAAVTPGQSAVFYDRDRVLGGGRIVRAEPAPSSASAP